MSCLHKIADVEKKQREIDAFEVVREAEISGFYQLERQIEVLEQAVRSVVTKPQHMLPFLQTGRLLHVNFLSELMNIFFPKIILITDVNNQAYLFIKVLILCSLRT